MRCMLVPLVRIVNRRIERNLEEIVYFFVIEQVTITGNDISEMNRLFHVFIITQ